MGDKDAASLTQGLPVNPNDIIKAAYRIRQFVPKSPLDYSPRLSKLYGAELFLKKEHLSLTGSYKERGALNKMMSLSDAEKQRGVVCSSAGNHAQAVSHHSTRLGINSVIVMPESTPFVKVAATQNFGGTVVLHGERWDWGIEFDLVQERTMTKLMQKLWRLQSLKEGHLFILSMTLL